MANASAPQPAPGPDAADGGDWRFDASNGLALFATRTHRSPVFPEFFAMYDRAFVLPDEKEDADGFRICLALNQSAEAERLTARHGRFCEACVVARDAATGEPLGGANFIALAGAPAATANLNYVFVAEEARGRGNFRRLVAGVRELIQDLFPGAPPLVFIEQNDPLAMSREAYERDTAYTGLDQLDRLRIWARMGARVVDFPYVQPPLSADQEADATLLYSVLGASGGGLEPGVLERHLAGFFGISVLKGADPMGQPAAKRQLQSLARMRAEGRSVPLRDPGALLGVLQRRADAKRVFGRPPRSFRAALARFEAAS